MLESLLTVAYVDYYGDAGNQENGSKVFLTEQNRRGNALKDVVEHFDDLEDDEKGKLKDYIDDFILVEAAARRAMVSLSSLAKRLKQPEFSTYIIARDHEDAFGASAGDAGVDSDYMSTFSRFLHKSGVLPGSHLEKAFKSVVVQDSNAISSFALCTGLKADNVTLACQLFGKSSDAEMIRNSKSAIDAVVKSRKEYEIVNKIKRKKKKKKDDSHQSIVNIGGNLNPWVGKN